MTQADSIFPENITGGQLILIGIIGILFGGLVGIGVRITFAFYKIPIYQAGIIALVLLATGGITGYVPHLYADYLKRKEKDGISFGDYIAELIGDRK